MPIGLGTGLAIAGGAALAGTAITALSSSSASKRQATAATDAAQIQSDTASRVADMQLGMFNTIRGDLTPYRSVGTDALPGFYALMGMSPPAGAPAPAPAPAAAPVSAAGSSTFTAGGLTGVPAPSGPDWDAYLQNNADVMAQYNRVNGPGLKFFLGMGGGPHDPGMTPQEFAQYHYQNFGQREGRQLTMYADPTPAPVAAPVAAPAAPVATGDAAPMPGPGGNTVQRFLESTPGYQFTRDQGMAAVRNQMAAAGLGGVSGAYGKGLARFVTGLADTTYQKQLDNYRSAVGVGQSAANQTGAFGQAAATGAGGSLIGGANASAAGITGAAQAGAAGTIGVANSLAGGLSAVGNTALTGSMFRGMYQQPAAYNYATDPYMIAGG